MIELVRLRAPRDLRYAMVPTVGVGANSRAAYSNEFVFTATRASAARAVNINEFTIKRPRSLTTTLLSISLRFERREYLREGVARGSVRDLHGKPRQFKPLT